MMLGTYMAMTKTMTEMPAVGLLVWVFGFGPDDVWSVGVGGGAVHWDGSSWEVLATGTTTDLWGIWGTSPSDLWVVGGDPNAGCNTCHVDCGNDAVCAKALAL